MAKANLDVLHTLHRKQAEYLIEALESGEELSSGTLAAINAFLKNNDITADIVEATGEGSTHLQLLKLIKKEA